MPPPHSEFKGKGTIDEVFGKQIKKILGDAKVLAAQKRNHA